MGTPFHNWWSAAMWRYLQYDFSSYMIVGGSSSEYEVTESRVYWWTDGGGVLMPDSIRISVWDAGTQAWVEVFTDYDGADAGQWNVYSFGPVTTNRIRISFKSNYESCGLYEWEVTGAPANAATFEYGYGNVENHTFQEYMRYIPLPYSQTLIMNNLKQNSGW